MDTMKRVILVHGFASPFSGEYDIDKLAPFWEAAGYEVCQFDYGFRLFVSLGNKKWAQKLREMTQDGDVLCAHSNGCLVGTKASFLGAPFSQMVFLAPALDVDAGVAPQVNYIHVWYTPTDLPVRIGGLFLRHPWGPMGAEGYQGVDPRFLNYNRAGAEYAVKSYTHLDFMYDDDRLRYFAPRIIAGVQAFSGAE